MWFHCIYLCLDIREIKVIFWQPLCFYYYYNLMMLAAVSSPPLLILLLVHTGVTIIFPKRVFYGSLLINIIVYITYITVINLTNEYLLFSGDWLLWLCSYPPRATMGIVALCPMAIVAQLFRSKCFCQYLSQIFIQKKQN